MITNFSPSDYQVTVTKCNNGYIVTLFDPYSNPIRTEIVHETDVSGYSDRALTPIILAQYKYSDDHLAANSASVLGSLDDTGNSTSSEFAQTIEYPDGTDS